MTPRELLKAWLDLSENRHLRVETYLGRGDELVIAAKSVPHPRELLIFRWKMLDQPQRGGVRPHEADPESYWTARKQLERDTRAYLETE